MRRPTPPRRPALAARSALAARPALTAALVVALVAALIAGPHGRFPADARPAEPADRVALTPGGDTARTVAVSFRAAGDAAHVEVEGPDGGRWTVPAALVRAPVAGETPDPAAEFDPRNPLRDATATARHFSATLDGLQPAAGHRYRPVVDGVEGSWRTFRTAAAGPEPFTFLAFGDAQTALTDVWPEVVRRAHAAVPDAALTVHAGDLVNRPERDEEWGHWFAGLGDLAATRPLVSVPGNHELVPDLFLNAYRGHFAYPLNGMDHFPETTYTVDHQGVRFVQLHANYMWMTGQAAWLDAVLAANPHPWAVVSFHEPIWSATTNRDDPLMEPALREVLERHDVDLVLTGHDHAYSRGRSLGRGTAEPGVSTGPVYVTSVAGGKYYPVNPHGNPWAHRGGDRLVAAGGLSTFQEVRVDGCRMDYRSVIAHVSDEATRPAAPGDTLDAVTIDRCGPAKRVLETAR